MSRADYYTPYSSGDDTEHTDESDLSDTEDPRVRREEDPRYAILRAPGPPLTTSAKQLEYQKGMGSPWDATTNITSLKNYTYMVAPKSVRTSLVSIKSSNRDKSVWPTPYNFQIKLPRVYTDVIKFQLTQMSFPNNKPQSTGLSLFASTLIDVLLEKGVPSSCISTCLNTINCTPSANAVAMIEMGRTNGAGEPLVNVLSLSDSSYNNTQLAQELTFQANNTPPLNLISYSTFYDIFTNTRDISVLFNEPGDNFQSLTNHQRYTLHTKDTIMNTYYTQQHIDSIPEITDHIAYTAYYFPILKEIIATQRALPFLQTGSVPFSDVQKRVMGPFEGLPGDFYYEMCSTNHGVLDGYRAYLTFELKNINQYKWSYQDKERKFVTLHDRLHTSIQRDLKRSYDRFMQHEQIRHGLTPHTFQTLQTNRSHSCIVKHLERNLSTVLGNYHFCNGYRYDCEDHITLESTFQAHALHEDEDFTCMFHYESTIGGIYGNYAGMRMRFTNFMDYHSSLVGYHGILQSTQQALSTIHGNVQYNYHTYVSNKYTGIFPDEMISNQSYTSGQALPVSFLSGQDIYSPGMALGAASPCLVSCLTNCQSTYSSSYQTCSTQYSTTYFTCSTTCGLSTNCVAQCTSTAQGTFTTCVAKAASTLSTCSSNCESNCSTIAGCTPICCEILSKLITKWYSNLPVNTVINTLAYRLGLDKAFPSTFNILSTVADFTSTGNLNYFMQINEEQGFNNIDVAMPENYAVSNETTGQIKLMSAKILMNGIGDTGISNTLIQNPTTFVNGLGKLDHLSIKVFYDDAALTPAWLLYPFTFEINEWNATFQIDEIVGQLRASKGWMNVPTIPILENPNQTPFLDYVKKDAT